MKTKLDRFKVYNFRSIEESDWISIFDNTCLIGTNEAGKTNLLIALWKLNPANNEPIVPLDDFPRHLYSNFKADSHNEDVFIAADFMLNEQLQQEIAKELKCDAMQVSQVLVERRYSGRYRITFPYSKVERYPIEKLFRLLADFQSKLNVSADFIKEEATLKEKISKFINEIKHRFSNSFLAKEEVIKLSEDTKRFMQDNFGRKKNLPDLFELNFLRILHKMIDSFEGKPIECTASVYKKVLDAIPKFVYYSDYGNLDSEIYLPRVIEDMGREDLSESARAKVRTLDVLFKYVKLSPKEIFELGNETKTIIKKVNSFNSVVSNEEVQLTQDEINLWADRKKERAILLRSAATQLTQRFKEWWLQGDYIFDFQADGRHFRINVSDSLRPEPIELEGRSRGLQWFFSFFLVFLVETKEEHSNTVLLLDEPGLSLHPIAQYDLAKFFRRLSEDNQLIYTSHSPFLVDMDNLGNVKAVYIDRKSGRTKVSSNLRYNETDSEKSIFPVHAALGLTVSDTLLLGCLPILVEGPSDQIYLSLIKRYLISKGELRNTKELVFIPTGGLRGMTPVTKLISAREDSLPYVILDSDKLGREFREKLINDRYQNEKEKVIGIGDFLGDKEYEIEDLFPSSSLIYILDKKYRIDNYFEDFYSKDKPIVPQIEEWAKENNINLEVGWKVEMARKVQSRFEKDMNETPSNLTDVWKTLFDKLKTE